MHLLALCTIVSALGIFKIWSTELFKVRDLMQKLALKTFS
jgi:hypothetical protein